MIWVHLEVFDPDRRRIGGTRVVPFKRISRIDFGNQLTVAVARLVEAEPPSPD